MPRGGRKKNRDAPERRCVVTGERGGKAGLVRFVLDPAGVVTPDLAERLPGRGVWATAERAVLEKAVRGAFARGFKTQARAPGRLADDVEAGLARRVISLMSLARKAGLAVCGFEKTRVALQMGKQEPAAIALAYDGAPSGKSKMRRFAEGLPEIATLSKAELGLAFGRSYVIHSALMAGELTAGILRDAARLHGFRGMAERDPAMRRPDASDAPAA